MFPLKTRQLIRGASAHVAAGLGIGADYSANYTELYLPFNGQTEWVWGSQGGWWYKVTRDNGDRIEMAHNSELKTLDAKEGDSIAITGNTGSVTTGPHLHIQIFDKNNNRLDPEQYDWGQEVSMPTRGEVEKLEEQLSATDKHQHFVRAAIISIEGGATPTENRVVTDANQNPDIQAYRKRLIAAQCDCPPCPDPTTCEPCPPCPECPESKPCRPFDVNFNGWATYTKELLKKWLGT